MQLMTPYLFFDGRCEEALDFYKKALGAEVTMLMRFKDSPEPPQPGMVPPGAENKVMHASFRIGDTKENFMNTNSGPGYQKHPGYRIPTRPANARVTVMFRGAVLADTRDAIRMDEGDYPAVYYIPRKDVKMGRLVRSSHHTYCPFKGQASYFSLANGPENAVWTYEEPYDEVAEIKERLAFYPDKVDSITVTD